MSADTEQGRIDEALHLAHLEARKPFDLLEGPLVRSTLLQLRADDHVLLLTLHHIVADGWSMGVLIREMAELYAGRSGQPSPLPSLAVQYPDMRCGSGDGSMTSASMRSWPGGVTGWQSCRYWHCPPIGRGRRLPLFAGRVITSRSLPKPLRHSRP